MNQIKIGKFIAFRRKQQNLTQMQLAEKLNITDRAVSKWENGKSLPDAAIMLELCNILEITVNDLLMGEVVEMDNNKKISEENILELVKIKEEKDKLLLKFEVVIGILSMVILLGGGAIIKYIPMEDFQRYIIIIPAAVFSVTGLFFAMKLEQIAGYYECEKCHHKYVPSFAAMFFAPHVGRTRYMKCPDCGEKSWQKKVITK